MFGNRESGIGNRESGIGNRESGIGNRESGIGEKFNNKFNILKAFGMMAVVGGHCGINFLPWFPVFSFHMPLFMFISGYFFRDKDFISFAKSKGKHLVVPLLAWNVFFGWLCALFHHYEIISFGSALSLKTLFIDPFTHGHQFAFNCPTWFVGTLIEVQFLYWGLHRLCRKNHIALLILTLFFHLAAWMMANNYWQKIYGDGMLAVEKVLFCLIFYEIGAVYRLYLEKKDLFSVNRIAGLILFNGFLLGFMSKQITMVISWMNMPPRIWLPLAAALSGIYLYMQVSDLLKDKVPRNSLLGYIGEHTFSIMTLHFFFFWLLNTAFWQLKEWGVFPLRSFDYDKYMHNIWFRVTEHAPMVDAFYFLVGLFGSLLCVRLYERFAEPHLKKYFRFL